MLQVNRRIKSADYVSNYETMFACPICHSSMKVFESRSLICSNHHTFDFAKQGYINFMTGSVKTKYSKELFEARRKLITECGFFQPLSNAVAQTINNHLVKTKEPMSILDVGCGEGSHLFNICNIVLNFYERVVGTGIDISKEGIIVASKNYPNKIWTVADLTNTPFKNRQFDVILNILSPSNYVEFKRLLKVEGLVIKVVPQSSYLKQLREHLFNKPEKHSYSNAEIVDRFNENFQLVDNLRVTYKSNLNQSSIQWLIQMAPLIWGTTDEDERVQSFLEKDSAQITIDLDILIGKNN